MDRTAGAGAAVLTAPGSMAGGLIELENEETVVEAGMLLLPVSPRVGG